VKPLFIDTSGWAAFLVHLEPSHRPATLLLEEQRRKGLQVITTNYLLAELVALLTSPLRVTRTEQIRILKTLRSADWIEVIHLDPFQEQEAWKIFATHDDKYWSLVDCASFAVMRSLSLSSALTTDHHFEQAGFTCLLNRK
jgi:predicted nucleic acid-binding protein